MVGRTLDEIRRRLGEHASPDGRYYLACARTGERPVPSGEHRFPDRETATRAADLVDAYRDELRRYDPRLPHYDVIVRELPSRTAAPDGPERDHAGAACRSEFCHEVTAAVFETLSGGGFRDAERAVMDTYLDAAETVTDPDDLCLLLLQSMGAVLDETLDAHEQEVVLNRAAGRLSPAPAGADALDDSLATVANAGLLADYSIDGPADARTVSLDGYALSRSRHVLTLPVAVELLRRRPGADLRFAPTSGDRPGFRVALADRARHDPRGLFRVAAP